MVFKTRKIPKHLIIREEYEIRKKPRFGVLRMLMVSVTVGHWPMFSVWAWPSSDSVDD